jgi:hypothetical protein
MLGNSQKMSGDACHHNNHHRFLLQFVLYQFYQQLSSAVAYIKRDTHN